MSDKKSGEQHANMKTGQLEPKSLGFCPCGRQIYADVRQGAALHEEPACKQFLELEPDKFLTYVRRSRGIAIEN